jgi:hypothetical protein
MKANVRYGNVTSARTDGKIGGPMSSEVPRFYTPLSTINKYFWFDNGEFIIYDINFSVNSWIKGGHQFSISNTDINGLSMVSVVSFTLE